MSIDGLAREFEVSPTPVREAMVSLERSGMVDYAPLRGYIVSPLLSEEQMGELLDTRKTVESAALSRSFSRWEALLPDLEQAHGQHATVVARIEVTGREDRGLLREHFRYDWAFHQTLFRYAWNRYLLPMVEPLRTRTHRMRQILENGPWSVDASVALKEHAVILQKVWERHHDGALEALPLYLDGVLRRSIDSP